MAASQRRFGVEIECGSDLSDAHNGCEKIERTLHSASRLVYNTVDSVDCDGTCAEVRTEPLQGEAGFRQLKAIFKFLRTKGKCYVTSSDGMHVHHDAPEFVDNWETTERLLRAWHRNEPHIVRMLPDRRMSQGKVNTASKKAQYSGSGWTPEQLQRVIERDKQSMVIYNHRVGGSFSRSLLNIGALSMHGTVEWRGLEGTLDYERARAWIEFGQRFMDWVLVNERKWTCNSTVALLSMLEVPLDQQKILKNAGRNDPLFRGQTDRPW